jgi:hypothetical protein
LGILLINPRKPTSIIPRPTTMATKPTRLQQQAGDHLAEALHLIAEAFRLDGRGKLAPEDLDQIARLIGPVSSAFPLDQIVVRALDRRAKALGLSSSAADLIALNEDQVRPLQTLLLGDGEFAELVQRLEEELGGI